MKEISSAAEQQLRATLTQLNETIKGLEKELAEALGFGDLSENTEYDTAKSNLTMRRQQKEEIEQLLRTARVRRGYSSTIAPGTLISVKVFPDNSEPEDMGLLMYDEVGDLLFNGKINPESPLGKVIAGGTSGTYHVQDMNGNPLRYEVTVEPESRLEEFMQKYSTNDKVMLARMFGGER